MATLLAQIAPQRSTQYSNLANVLGPLELRLSSLGNQITAMAEIALGGQGYLKFETNAELNNAQVNELGTLAMTSNFFHFYEQMGSQKGPFLRPIETRFRPLFPPDSALTRRYRGKTNEMFTHFLCNIAKFSSKFSRDPWHTLRIFDPLAGGGTTLFTALILGADAAGIEKNAKNAQSTVAFIKQYTKEQGIPCEVKEERLKKLGKRWWFTIGNDTPKRCLLAKGETSRAVELASGFRKPHLIVTDLPYGIQHRGGLLELLSNALPIWSSMLSEGGTIAMAWDATRFPRQDMVTLIEAESPLKVHRKGPYNMMAHRVDRVIKIRDVVVAGLEV
jgi:hypothetical protein